MSDDVPFRRSGSSSTGGTASGPGRRSVTRCAAPPARIPTEPH